MKLNELLKELRISKGFSQDKMAEIINVNRTTYANYEQGRREPDLITLVKISDYHDVSIDYLLGREKDYKLPQIKKDLDFKSKSHEKLFMKLNELDQDELLMIEGYVNKLIESKELKKLLEMKG